MNTEFISYTEKLNRPESRRFFFDYAYSMVPSEAVAKDAESLARYETMAAAMEIYVKFIPAGRTILVQVHNANVVRGIKVPKPVAYDSDWRRYTAALAVRNHLQRVGQWERMTKSIKRKPLTIV